MSHTPTPWRRCSAHRGNCPCGLIWSVPNDCIVATVQVPNGPPFEDGVTREQANVNGDFIVHAVNCHEELLRALKLVADFNDGDIDDSRWNDNPEHTDADVIAGISSNRADKWESAMKAVRAAIAKSTKVPPKESVDDPNDHRVRCPKCGLTKWTWVDGNVVCASPGCRSPIPKINNATGETMSKSYARLHSMSDGRKFPDTVDLFYVDSQ